MRGVHSDGGAEGVRRLLERALRARIPEGAPLEVGLGHFRPHRARLREALLFLRADRHGDVPRDVARNLVLQRQHVLQRAGEGLAPQVFVRKRIDQLSGDAHLRARSGDGPLDEILDAERSRNLRGRRPAAAIAQRGLPRDHPNRAHLGEIPDEHFRDAVGKVLVCGAGQALERKDGDGDAIARTVGTCREPPAQRGENREKRGASPQPRPACPGRSRRCRFGRLQGRAHLVGRLVPTGDVLFQAPANDRFEAGRHRRVERFRIVPEDRGTQLERRLPAKRRPAGDHLVQDDAERPQVTARIDTLVAEHLRWHVAQRAGDGTGLFGLPRHGLARSESRHAPGHPEIQHLHVGLGGDHDVGGLEVRVNQTGFMRVRERVGNLERVAARHIERQRAAVQTLLQRDALHQLHAQVGPAVVLADVVDVADIRMREPRRLPRLGQQAGVGRRVAAAPQHLEGVIALEPQMPGAVHVAHPAGSQPLADLVIADPGPDRQIAVAKARERRDQRVVEKPRRVLRRVKQFSDLPSRGVVAGGRQKRIPLRRRARQRLVKQSLDPAVSSHAPLSCAARHARRSSPA